MRRLGAHEFRRHFSRVVADVERGASFAITRHGRQVAILLPATASASQMTPTEAITGLRAFRRGRLLGKTSIRELVDEGRCPES